MQTETAKETEERWARLTENVQRKAEGSPMGKKLHLKDVRKKNKKKWKVEKGKLQTCTGVPATS